MLEVEVANFSISPMGYALILKPVHQRRVVPMFIGAAEMNAIANAKDGVKPERPLTHDLASHLLKEAGARVEKVFIHKYNDGIFYARLFLELNDAVQGMKISEIDARPSDGVALALRFSAPIFMAEHVYELTSVEPEQMIEPAGEAVEEDLLDEEKESLINALMEELNETVIENAPFQSRLDVLKQKLGQAIQTENYEEAARLRDEISNIENEF
ncbi:MAG: bifunctional nuclease family protein [Leptospiraceae bacterium]|nr:bifunctional nuclease family protein [Leptospiraceae bacterium]MCB1201223.1 bifunctional nuclease family protein [Leptospiraceae bacterium]